MIGLVERKLRRLKGELVDDIPTDGVEILNDDQAERAFQAELDKLEAFQKKVNAMRETND